MWNGIIKNIQEVLPLTEEERVELLENPENKYLRLKFQAFLYRENFERLEKEKNRFAWYFQEQAIQWANLAEQNK